jgi:pimeloyl-ACP methyl ester carboxylesterase
LGSGRLETLDLAGDEARAPIVLLHGGLSSLGLWRGLPERLAAATGRRTVAFSRLGHGASDPPPRPSTVSFMHDAARELLPEVFARLGVERPVLVGHSDGASIALLYAADNEVEALALLAPHAFVEEQTLRGIRAAREDFERGGLRASLARHHRDPEVAFHEWCDVWLDPAFRPWNIEAAVERVAAPTLLIQGTEDEYGTLAQLDAIERRLRGPVTRLELGGDHFPHRQSPAEVESAIVTLIAELR